MKSSNSKSNIFNKNKSIAIGAGLFLLDVVLLTGLTQYFVAIIFGLINTDFEFHSFIFRTIIVPNGGSTVIAFVFVYLSPFLFNVLLLEIGISLLAKTTVSKKRFAIIIFNLGVVGYLIVNLFYGAIISQISTNSTNDWNQLMLQLKIDGHIKLVFMIVVILTFTVYLKRISKQLLGYIN